MDDREQDGSNDWYGGGWTRVPADGNIPVGTRRFVGAGKITILDNEVWEGEKAFEYESEVSSVNDTSGDSEDEESDMVSMVENWSLELGQMLENPESNENIDLIKQSMDEKFESEVNQLPLVARTPARAIWNMKSDAIVTIAKTKLSNDNAKIVAGLGIAGAAVGALSSVNSITEKDENFIESKSEINMQKESEEKESLESSNSRPPDEEIESVIDENMSDENVSDENMSDENMSDSEVTSISLEEIINQMNGARFLNEQKELISSFKGSIFELSFRVNSVDRTFGIGISDEYKRGNTLHVTSGINDIEVRMTNDYDSSKILTGTEMSLQVSVDSWNGIRKRLIVNSI